MPTSQSCLSTYGRLKALLHVLLLKFVIFVRKLYLPSNFAWVWQSDSKFWYKLDSDDFLVLKNVSQLVCVILYDEAAYYCPIFNRI